MLDKLPYETTTGVIATREGLVVKKDALTVQAALLAETHGHKILIGWQTVFPWPDIAERTRYRKGEPWCRLHFGDSVRIVNEPSDITPDQVYAIFVDTYERRYLHRIVSILADNAEAFRVLHWCINNLAKNP